MKKGRLLAFALAVSTAFTMLAPSTGLMEAGTVRAENTGYKYTIEASGEALTENYNDVTSGSNIIVSADGGKVTLNVTVTTGTGNNVMAVSGTGIIVHAFFEDDTTFAKFSDDGDNGRAADGIIENNIGNVGFEFTFEKNDNKDNREAKCTISFDDKNDTVGKCEFAFIQKGEENPKGSGNVDGEDTFKVTSGSAANITSSSADISFYANKLGTYTYTVSTDGKEIAKSETAGKIESETKATTFKVSDLDSDTKYTVTIEGTASETKETANTTVEFTTKSTSSSGGSGGGGSSNSTTVKNADGSTTTTTTTAKGTITTTTKTNADGSKSTKKVVANKDGSGSVTETTVSAKGTTKSVEVVTDTTGAVTEVSTSVSNAKGVGMSASYKANGTKLTLSKIETEGKTAVTIPATVKCDGKTYKVTKIGTGAMSGNKEIKTVTLGKNITVIGKNAFKGASKLKTISLKKAPTKVGKNAFKGIKKNAVIKIKATKKAFKAAKKLIKKSGIASTVKIKRVK